MLTRTVIDLVKEDLGLGKSALSLPAGSPMMKAPSMPPLGAKPTAAVKGLKIPGAQPTTQKAVNAVISPTNAPGGRQPAGREGQISAFK